MDAQEKELGASDLEGRWEYSECGAEVQEDAA